MLRAIAAFLFLFWLVGLSVHLDGSIHLFALLGVLCVAADFLFAPHRQERLSHFDGQMWL